MIHFDLSQLIQTIGYAGLFGIIFAESGLLFGFFLPGDSLLFTAGLLASQGIFSLPILLVGCFLSAVLGDNVGYAFGNRVGKKLFNREDSIFFHKSYIKKAQEYYERHGAKTIVLARFIPVVRTFAPIVAGIGSMNYKTFVTYNLIGGVIWAIGIPTAGYYLGKLIPNVDKYLLPIIIVIVFSSILPQIIHIIRDKNHRKEVISGIKKLFNRNTK